MSSKSKVAICLIILAVVILGLLIGNTISASSSFVDEKWIEAMDNNGQLDIKDLAAMAASTKRKDGTYTSIMKIPQTELTNKYIRGAGAAIYYRSGMCMYHAQSGNEGYFKIYHVLDFIEQEGKFTLLNNGVKVETDQKTWILAKALRDAWKGSDWYNDDSFSNDLKEIALKAFYNARGSSLGGINAAFGGSQSGGATSITKVLEDYAAEAAAYVKISKVTATVPNISYNGSGDLIVGPLKVTYGGKKIDKIKIYTSDSNKIEKGDKGDIYWSKSKTGSWSNILSNIPSNTAFYLKVAKSKYTPSSTATNINLDITQKGIDQFRGRVLLAAKQDAGAQQMGIYEIGEEKNVGSVNYSVNNIPSEVDITINKKDEKGTKLTGAIFKVRVLNNKDEKVGWLSGTEGSYKYNNNKLDDGSEFKVNNGVVNINGLSKNYKYAIYETKEANSCLPLKDQIAAGMKVNGSTLDSGNYNSTYKILKCITIDPDSASGTQTVTINVVNQRPKANITINKKDENGVNLTGAKFKVKVLNNKDEKVGWLSVSNNAYKYDNSKLANGTEWEVKNGVLNINGLSKNYKYAIYETKEADGCIPLENQIAQGMKVNGSTLPSENYNSEHKILKCITIEPDSTNKNYPVTIEITNQRPKVNITINKKDETGANLTGAIFKVFVENKGWLGGTEGNYTIYENNLNGFNQATEWKVNKGVIAINGLSKDDNYAVYETKEADYCLPLSEQLKAGMKINGVKLEEDDFKDDYMWKTYGVLKCAAIFPDDTNVNYPVEIDIENIEDYLDISGKIWEDRIGTKSDEYDSKYVSGTDSLYTGQVTISLMNSSGKVVKTVTTTNGNYKMTTPITVATSMNHNQVKAKLEGYYLKFEYASGYTEANSKISYYATVAPTTATNGSKAIPNSSDSNTSGKAYIYKLSDYVNSTNYVVEQKTSTHELQNMNMGLVKIENNYDYNIEQALAYVKVVINGYTYTYEYGGTANTAATAAPKVQYDNGWAYTRPIYPSDIQYSKANGWNDSSLKVYVVYRIDIKDIDPEGNANLTKEGTTKQVSYVEVDLKVDSLTNSYDTNRYELEKDYDKSTNGDFDDWDNNASTGVATYKGTKLNNAIKPNETKTVYIQFKVKDSALEDLLTKGTTYERKATVATAKAYHNYWKSYYAWNDSKVSTLVKEDKTTKTVTKNADSIYLKLQLGTERTITGKVFEDKKVSTNGEALGNGKYDSGENKIANVKVDLLLENKTTIATIYKKNGVNYDELPATTKTNTDGTYSLNGVTPGKYYVRFTYGDGTYSIEDYKSTIVTENNIKTALKTGDENWYKKVSDIEHSTAVDNLEQRGQYNDDRTSRSTIEANTALTSIGVENDKEGSYISVVVTNSIDGHKETINGINLGIIKQPKVEIESDKVVTYIKIINTQGNIISEGNPATQNIKYVSDLDGENHLTEGSTYVKVEINENELYGSTLEIQYSITVQNKSDVNYYEDKTSSKYGYYYKFGEKTSDAKEVTYTADVVYDYVDSAVKSESVKLVNDPPYVVDIVSMSAASDKEKELVKNVKDNITGCDYEYLIKINGWNKDLKTIKTQKVDGSQKYSTEDTKEVVDFKVSRLLSVEDDDLVVSNVAQVANFKKPDSPLVQQPEPQQPSDEVVVTVIPPTGEDTLTPLVYIITIVIAGAVTVLGVIIIKKKVLNK